MKPTDEQVKEFWEKLGVKGEYYVHDTFGEFGGRVTGMKYPPIDLNNLFKYAVPKLLGGDRYLFITFDVTSNEAGLVACEISTLRFSDEGATRIKWEASDNDPALALFWAIWAVFHGN